MPFPPTHPALGRALSARDYAEPTPVQRAVLADEATGRDLLVSAQTGSGKTVAFGLALAPTLLGEAERFGDPSAPLAMIIAPTRELALQVHRELVWLYAETGARILTCVGGMDPRREARELDQGAHMVVGTPGRLRDHMERGRIDTSLLRAVVLDEADEMLDLGFREDLEFLLDSTPPERRTLLFSATIARDIALLARRYQRDALRIDTLERDRPHADIEYRAIRVAPNEIELGVVNVLRFFDAGAALVFCATREAVRHLHAALVERGFAAVALSGEMDQNERNRALQSLRDGRTRVCVATDVAARGLDLPQLDLVIHADLPANRETLLHRSGRTGRAGRKGISVLLVPYTRGRRAAQLLSLAGVEAGWSGPPAAEEIRRRDDRRLLDEPLFAEPAEGEDVAAVDLLLGSHQPERVALALLRLYRARLPAPEELFDGGSERERGPRQGRERPSRERPHERPGRERGPRESRDAGRADGEMTWFRINVGRQQNADPKWLLPLLCRLGHVTRREIGAIRVFDRETKFEVAGDAADRFRAAVEKSGEAEFAIHPAGAPAPRREQRAPTPSTRPRRRDEGAPPDQGAPPDRGEPPRDEPPRDETVRREERDPSIPARGRRFGDRPAKKERPWRKPATDRPKRFKPRRDAPSGGDAPPRRRPR
jgi:ATP-dependent RNA helicase DeaD